MNEANKKIILSTPSTWLDEKYSKSGHKSIYPELIYKFRDWNHSYNRDTLLKQELYFSSPKDFNDPFDCRITKRYELLETKEKKDQFVNTLLIENFEKFNSNIEGLMHKMDVRLTDPEKIQQEYEALTFAAHDQWYGVLCFSSYWNNILMWSHYANYHKGICIGFYEKKLREGVGVCSGGMVTYNTEIPVIDPLETDAVKEMFLTTQSKAAVWKYESEYRITKLFWDETEPHLINRIINYPINAIAEVILGLAILPEHKTEVVKFCAENNIPIYQAQKVKNRFELTCDFLTPRVSK